MAIDFPNAPTEGQEFIAPDGFVYKFVSPVWVLIGTYADLNYVKKAGDTMTGALAISSGGITVSNGDIQVAKTAGYPGLYFNYAGSYGGYLQVTKAYAPRFEHYFDDTAYYFKKYNDAGVGVNMFTATRSDGLITVLGNPTANLGVATKQYVDAAAAAVSVKVTRFTANGTYTPDAKMLFAEIICYGGGGAGGGANTTAAAQGAAGSGGSGGGKSMYRGTPVGAQTVTIGTGGTGVAGSAGGAGTNTSVGSLCIAPGGGGGTNGVAGAGPNFTPPGNAATGSGSGNMFAGATRPGDYSYIGTSATQGYGGNGGQTDLGGTVTTVNISGNGNNAFANTGSGGSGGLNLPSQAVTRAGGNGGSGLAIVTEFLKA